MAEREIILSGTVKATSIQDAKQFVRDLEQLVNAFPMGHGLPSKIVPMRRMNAPVSLASFEIIGVVPIIMESGRSPTEWSDAEYMFSVVLILRSSELEAINWLVTSRQLVHEVPRITHLTWSAPAPVGEYDRIWKE